MGKQKTASTGGFFQELFHAGVYKRSQGRITRQVTFAVIAVATALAAWKMNTSGMVSSFFDTFGGNASSFFNSTLDYFVPGFVLALGIWIGYRVVNLPSFADFLIAVEAEMNKVSWPSRSELYRSSVVVIVVIFLLAGILFGFDFIWQTFFRWIGVLYSPSDDA